PERDGGRDEADLQHRSRDDGTHDSEVTSVCTSVRTGSLRRAAVSDSTPNTTPVTAQSARAPPALAIRNRQISVAGAVTASGDPGSTMTPIATSAIHAAATTLWRAASAYRRVRIQRPSRNARNAAPIDQASTAKYRIVRSSIVLGSPTDGGFGGDLRDGTRYTTTNAGAPPGSQRRPSVRPRHTWRTAAH